MFAARHVYSQREIVQIQPKNSSRGIEGVSDHDPIVLTMYKYRE